MKELKILLWVVLVFVNAHSASPSFEIIHENESLLSSDSYGKPKKTPSQNKHQKSPTQEPSKKPKESHPTDQKVSKKQTAGNMNQQVQKGQAPKSVTRVDSASE